jgi:RNA-directed DNA polymerase
VQSRREKFTVRKRYESGVLKHPAIGFLPQGAPTSPMLANLVMRKFDRLARRASANAGLRYSRYADDLIFSTAGVHSREGLERFVKDIYQLLGACGFEANRTKTVISPPGARKVVLGLLVDGDEPRLTRDFKDRLAMHMHFLRRKDVGPVAHAAARDFASVIGLQNHLYGLVAFASQVEPEFAARIKAELKLVDWPV